jgi:S1-C subfamily serine protease
MIRPLGGLVHYSRLARAGLSGLALCLLIPAAQGGTQESPSKGILHLVVIKIEMRGYRTVAAGTAFFISPEGTALTNGHVVELVRRDPAAYRLVAIIGREFYGAKIVCANPLPAEAGAHTTPGRDLAEIQLMVPDFPFEELTYDRIGMARPHRGPLPTFPALRLGDAPEVGDPVRVLGYGVRDSMILPSEWSATGTVRRLSKARDGTPVFTIKFEREAEHGHSGSPVLNMKSEVVGIFTWIGTSDKTMGIAISRPALDPMCADLSDHPATIGGPP